MHSSDPEVSVHIVRPKHIWKDHTIYIRVHFHSARIFSDINICMLLYNSHPRQFRCISKYMCINDAKGSIEIAHSIGDIYDKNSKISNLGNFMLCRRFAKISKLILNGILVSYTVGVILNWTPVIYKLLAPGESALPARIVSLYFEQESAFDFILEWMVNIVELFICLFVRLRTIHLWTSYFWIC